MRSVYEIAGIVIDFTYQYSEFFDQRIERYSSNLPPKYKMEVQIREDFLIPTVNPSVIYKNRNIYYLKSKTVITVFKEELNAFSHLISYNSDFTEIIIVLNPLLGDKLPELEYLLSGVFFYEIALKEGLITLHASAISYHEQALLFSAPSQTGKSTLTNYFLKMYTDAFIINDDKPLIKQEGGHFYVYGSPWSGKDVFNSNSKVMLHTIFFLEQGLENKLIPLTKKEKINELFRNIYRPREESQVNLASDTLSSLIENASMMKYAFLNDSSAAITIQDYLGGVNK